MGDPVARACIIPELHSRYLMSSDGIRLVVDKNLYDPYFIYLLINSPNFRIQAENASTGTTRKRIGLKELRTLKVYCPHIDEQIRIAKIFFDLNVEIESLYTQLEKYKMIKIGTMQNLLTGKIRLHNE
jgi:type I restriction enzyme S subunit